MKEEYRSFLEALNNDHINISETQSKYMNLSDFSKPLNHIKDSSIQNKKPMNYGSHYYDDYR